MRRAEAGSRTTRRLCDLVSVGPATLYDFRLLGIETVERLAAADPDDLHLQLCRIRGEAVDVCCRDVFAAAIAQSRDPSLPAEQKRWWYWSRKRIASRERG
jgi:pathogenicity locus Cdd1 protein